MTQSVGDRSATVRHDYGFTLIEVVISLSLLAILATAALYFFVGGTRTISHQQRAQGAVTLANGAMEEAFSWVPTASSTGISGLVVGRTNADVSAAWALAAAAGVSGVSDTFPAWDTATVPAPIAGTADDVIDLTSSATESGVRYDVVTLIGTCYRATAATDAPCTMLGGSATGTPDAGYVRLMRAIVFVTWPDTAGSCGGTTCSYEIASLIDPHSDVKWNNTTRLLAVDDSIAVNAGATVVVAVLDNDTVMQIVANPVSKVSEPVRAGTSERMGSAVLDTATGKFTYTAVPTASAPAALHGHVTFTYRVTIGARTAQAVVHLYVTPQATALAASTVVGTPVAIPVTTVSGARPTGLTITTPPSAGSITTDVTSNPAVFRYTPSGAGTYTFSYTYLDSDGMTSLPGIATVTVATLAAPVATPIAIPLAASTAPVATVVPLPTQPGSGYKVRIIAPPTGGVVRVDGQDAATVPNLTGAVATFTPPANVAGVYTFTYQMVTPDGTLVSSTETVTVTVAGPPIPESFQVEVRKRESVDFFLRSVPSSGVEFTQTSNPSCGVVSTFDSVTGGVRLKANNRVGTCTFTYQVRTAGSSAPWSANATVTVKVKEED